MTEKHHYYHYINIHHPPGQFAFCRQKRFLCDSDHISTAVRTQQNE
ncbi:hypothetical protein CKO_01065 [Citrobacter koseri ATCC BAA-895]|uniref:Uncharacterized protein n=1 Tax=Citrobacter koseri (strain ATCC BAA-895 / CDC 4225-83 / SGSC4696) TaxID=290338 RepID=A8AFE5_CITK8|nr:hypothetical protein CKO_01065 [Citrobacter koseri ATCC BAA-895]